jgi:mannitol-1-phosphate/altronate dehydrogenase
MAASVSTRVVSWKDAAARKLDVFSEAFVTDPSLFGDLSDDPRFMGAYRCALDSLHRNGARATLQALADR